MYTVELLERAIQRAREVGYQVRIEWLGGRMGGACELRGRKLLLLDVAADPREQLEQVLDALRRAGIPRFPEQPISLSPSEQLRRSA